jgi:Flp pilus assembly protein TadG
MKKNIHNKPSRRGAMTLEFTLSFLLFFTVVYGIMEFGRIVASYNILAGAAREGARYAIVHGSASGSAATASDIQTVVRHWAIGLDQSSVNVTTTWTPGNTPGSVVRVQAQYNVTPFTSLITQSITLQSNSQLVISQ